MRVDGDFIIQQISVMKHYHRRRFDIRTKQDDGNPWTNQVLNILVASKVSDLSL